MNSHTRFLERPGGLLAFTVTGSGPLVICAPGMGELKESYQGVVSRLESAGYRAAALDLRGHGESDTTFDTYDNTALASDYLALARHLGDPAILIGSSMAAGAAVIAAALSPQDVRGLVLAGPFVRNSGSALSKALLDLLLARPWGRHVWRMYYRSLFKGSTPTWLPAHQDNIHDALASPDRWRAFRATTRTDHSPASEALPQVTSPALVVMGTGDPDWKDPVAEATWLSDKLGCPQILVSGAGHYPLVEDPNELINQMITHLDQWSEHA